jgi:hypothetical protein
MTGTPEAGPLPHTTSSARREWRTTRTWSRYCRQFGYDINRRENGVMLPSVMDVACEFHVPVHRGNHASGWAHDVQLAYPNAVMAQLRKVKARVEQGAFCGTPEALTRLLDEMSGEHAHADGSMGQGMESPGSRSHAERYELGSSHAE